MSDRFDFKGAIDRFAKEREFKRAAARARQLMRKRVVVGEAPNNPLADEPFYPIRGKAWERLLELCPIVEGAHTTNLLPAQPRAGKGRAFDEREAHKNARKAVNEHYGARFLLLGKRVGKVFGVQEFLKVHVSDMGAVMMIPHPSGVVRWWNDEKNRREARRLTDEFFKEVTGHDG